MMKTKTVWIFLLFFILGTSNKNKKIVVSAQDETGEITDLYLWNAVTNEPYIKLQNNIEFCPKLPIPQFSIGVEFSGDIRRVSQSLDGPSFQIDYVDTFRPFFTFGNRLNDDGSVRSVLPIVDGSDEPVPLTDGMYRLTVIPMDRDLNQGSALKIKFRVRCSNLCRRC